MLYFINSFIFVSVFASKSSCTQHLTGRCCNATFEFELRATLKRRRG